MDLFLISLNRTYPAAEVAGVEAATVVDAVVVVALWVAAAAMPAVGNVLKLNAPALPDAIPKPETTKN